MSGQYPALIHKATIALTKDKSIKNPTINLKVPGSTV